MMNFEGKRFLVTGASSGIGRGISVLLASLGATLIITGRNAQNLQETFDALPQKDHLMILADVTVDEDLNKLTDAVGFVNGVVFCAGVIDYLPVKFLSYDKIHQIFSVNFTSQVLLTQRLLKAKKIKKESSIVYISSLSSKLGVAGTAMYAASKAALSSFSKVLATELAGQKIRVNAISPGIVKTPMTQSQDLGISETDLKNDEDKYPLGHGNVEDVASYVSFLLSDSSKWITGSDLVMDGGFTLN